MLKNRQAFNLLPSVTEDIEVRFTAMPEGIGAKSYPVYKTLENGSVYIPKSKIARPDTVFFEKDFDIKLRDYQITPVAEAVRLLTTEISGLLLKAGCGMGKTVIALAICEKLSIDSVIILVDQTGIADQWKARIEEFVPGASIAVFHSKADDIDTLGESKAKYKIVVAQSLMRKDWATNPVSCDFLICDEAHVFSAPCFCAAIYNIDYKRSIALTATEDRKDGLTWVFLSFLGERILEVKGKTMTAKVLQPHITVNIDWHDYGTAWCRVNNKLTWKAKCRECPLFNKFPVRCGGGLPISDGKIKWNLDKLMWTSLLVDLCADKAYLDWFVPVITKFFHSGRQLLVFNQFRDPLQYLREKLVPLIGEENVGVYTSDTKNSERQLSCAVTLTTYKMCQKALDVPWKDSVIMSSPVSDIRQTVGRSTRVMLNKKQPIIFDPIITNVIILERQSRKRTKQYRELGFDI